MSMRTGIATSAAAATIRSLASGGARAQTCRGYNGTNCNPAFGSFWYGDEDFTPISSVRLFQ